MVQRPERQHFELGGRLATSRFSRTSRYVRRGLRRWVGVLYNRALMKQRMKKTHPRGKGVLIALGLVLLWLVAAAVGGPYFGKIDEVASNDLSTFLPESSEATDVKETLEKFQDSSTLPAVVVFESETSLSTAQKAEINEIKERLDAAEEVVGTIAPAITAKDNRAAFLVVPLASDAEFERVVLTLQQSVAEEKPSLDYRFTGPAMFSRDLNKAFAGIDGTLLFVALTVVFVILLVVYRSPILPIVTLLGAVMALAVAIFVVWHLADAGLAELNGQVQGILFILVIGAATDYSLLYIARYREELTHHQSAWQATKASWGAAVEPILAAGGTVTLGLLCLLASDLGSNKALGPVGGIGIALSVLAALTFLPAVLLLFGRVAFWPRRPQYVPNKKQTDYQNSHPTWHRVGQFVGRHPRRIWVVSVVLLLAACVAVPQLKADGVSQENLIIGKSEAREGQEILSRHFPDGSGSPAYVVVSQEQQEEAVTLLDSDEGVDGVSVLTTDSKTTAIPTGEQRADILKDVRSKVVTERTKQLRTLRDSIETQMAGAPQLVIDQAYDAAAANVPSIDELVKKTDPFKGLKPKVVDGNIALQATLIDSASSIPARDTVQRLRGTFSDQNIMARVGGVSAIQLDTNTASDHDLRVIIPLILLAITLVLMVLLRAIVAPFLLLLTTVISFGATLGIAALLFNHIWGFPGADPSVIIYGFVFLVALGIDYNIFLMTRVREETIKLGVRRGTLKGLVVTGGVITSAGIVLAATFAALYVIPILFLAQIAFIVAFGVLLDTLLVRSLLVPALTLEVGKVMWWPSKLAKKGKK